MTMCYYFAALHYYYDINYYHVINEFYIRIYAFRLKGYRTHDEKNLLK